MKAVLTFWAVLVSAISFSQDEFVRPLLTNPNISANPQQKAGTTFDSTFIYNIDTLDLPLFDDFSISKFIPYNAYFNDANVTPQTYYHLMNAANTIPQSAGSIFCDSSHAHHDTISIAAGVPTTTTDYFTTPVSVWVNDLTAMPVNGQLRTLYEECYVLIDSIIDGVPDADQDTIFYTTIPDFVQDSATIFIVDYTDPSKIWVDDFAYHNYTYAVDPWSLGVATLDGVDENGWPYDFGNINAHESADVLTSRPINLAGATNVYLTFLFQAEGYGNAPELDDSLLLEFWIVDSNKWMPSGWFQLGAITNDIWDTVHWELPTAALDDGFRFRFRNWASTSGNLDHWHIDYVTLEANGTDVVDYFNDLAISKPINSFLQDYTSVPWDHYRNTTGSEKMVDTSFVQAFNSSPNAILFADGGVEITLGGAPEGFFLLENPGTFPGWNVNWDELFSFYPYFVSLDYSFDQNATTATQASFDVKLNIAENTSINNDHEVNDTVYFVQDFRNYYSYDDGSAEAAYGITGSHSLLAYKFTAYEEDTLVGVLMHFMPSVDDHSDELFLLTIWDDNGGQPGNIIYQDDYFNTHSPEYSGALNGFKFYTFMGGISVVVPETFYVGWEQIGTTSLNVGMDHNIDNGDKIFRNVSGTWMTSSFQSSLLIRPVFSTAMNETLSSDAGQTISTPQAAISIYPNPTTDFVNVVIDAADFTVRFFDLTGRLVLLAENEKGIDVSFLNTGVYIVEIRDVNGVSLYSGKLIKE